MKFFAQINLGELKLVDQNNKYKISIPENGMIYMFYPIGVNQNLDALPFSKDVIVY